MLQKHYLKPILTLDVIGITRFRLGIVMGCLLSLAILLLYNTYSKASLAITILQLDDIFYNKTEELEYYEVLNAFVAAAFGFCFTQFIWFSNLKKRPRRKTGFHFLMRATPMIIFSVFLAIIGRYLSLMTFIIDTMLGETGYMDIWKVYDWELYLVPLFIFLALWMNVRLVFKGVLKWIGYSFIFFIVWAFTLTCFSDLKHQDVKEAAYKRYAKGHEIIENELKEIKKLYHIDVTEEEKKALMQRRSKAAGQLLDSLAYPFYLDPSATSLDELTKVPLKTIVLEKLIVKLRKVNNVWHYHGYLPYVAPQLISAHLKELEYTDVEQKALIELLIEEIKLANELHKFGYSSSLGITRWDITEDIKAEIPENTRWTIHEWRFYMDECRIFCEDVTNTYLIMKKDTVLAKWLPLLPEPDYKLPTYGAQITY